MRMKRIAISLVLALAFTLLPVNLMAAYADVGDAPTYIYADEDKGQLFVYWNEVKWDDGYMEEAISEDENFDPADFDLDYYEVYCKYPDSSDYQLVKKIDADDDEYRYYDEYIDDEGYEEFVDLYGFYMPVTQRGVYEFKIRAHYYDHWDSKEVYSPWTFGDGAYLNFTKTLLQTKALSATEIELTWDVVEGADGYTIYRSKTLKGKYTEIGYTTKDEDTSWIDDDAKANTKYYYYVAPYISYGDYNYEGYESNRVSGYAGVEKVKLTQVMSYSKKVIVKWAKAPSASGYEVYRSTSSGGNYKKIATITSGSKTSYTDSGKTARVKYYYKVRAYKNVNGKKLTGPYSSWKSVIASNLTLTQAQARKAYLALRNDCLYFPSTLIVNKIYWGTIKGNKVIMIDYSAENVYGVRTRSYFTYWPSDGDWNHNWRLSNLKGKKTLNKYPIIH